jgi:hypothetical protein
MFKVVLIMILWFPILLLAFIFTKLNIFQKLNYKLTNMALRDYERSIQGTAFSPIFKELKEKIEKKYEQEN